MSDGAAPRIELRDWAVGLARSGFRVFPLRPGEKTPNQEGWQARATCDPTTVAKLWTCPVTGDAESWNVGLATGSGLVVIDIDDKDGRNGSATLDQLESEIGPFPSTMTVQTASGGRHIYLLTDPTDHVPNSAGRLGIGLDVRGDGGYVVGPGSLTSAGAYTLIARSKPALLPASLREKLIAPRPPSRAAEVLGDLDGDADVERAVGWLRTAPEAIQGSGGDAATVQVAQRVGDFGVSEGLCLELMLEHWNDRCSPPWDPSELEVKVGNGYRYRQTPVGSTSGALEFDHVELLDNVAGELGEPRQWPEPSDPWARDQDAGDVFADMLPRTLAAWCADEARRKGVTLGGVAVPALVVFAAALSSRFVVQVRQHDSGYLERPILWGALVGGPGSRKTPVLKEVMQPIEAVQRGWMVRFSAAMRVYEAQSAALKKPGGAGPPVSRPRERLKVIHDVTAEAVVLAEAENPDGLLLFRDELAGWAGGMDAYGSGRSAVSKDAPFWLEAKSGSPYRVRRVGREAVSAEVHAVHVLGGIQPEVVRKLAGDWTGNGLFQRFLLAHLPEVARSPDIAPNDAVRAEIFAAVRRILTLEPNDFTEPFRFAPEADAYRLRLLELQTEWLLRPDFSEAMKGWVAKLEGEWARIATVMHVADWATSVDALLEDFPPAMIMTDSAQRAFRFLTEFQLPQQIQFYGRTAGTVRLGPVRKVAGHVLAHKVDRLTDSELQRKFRHDLSGRENERTRQDVMGHLEGFGWVEPDRENSQGKTTTWLVNPAVHDGRFEERAIAEAATRNAARSAIAMAGAARGSRRLEK